MTEYEASCRIVTNKREQPFSSLSQPFSLLLNKAVISFLDQILGKKVMSKSSGLCGSLF